MTPSTATALLAFATGFPATQDLFAAALVKKDYKTGETVLTPKGRGTLVLLTRKVFPATPQG